MHVALEVLLVMGKKFVVVEIQGDRQVLTSVQVRVIVTPLPNDETSHNLSLHLYLETLRGGIRKQALGKYYNLVGGRHLKSWLMYFHSATVPFFIAMKMIDSGLRKTPAVKSLAGIKVYQPHPFGLTA